MMTLKQIWIRRGDGQWAVTDLIGLDLKGKKADSDAFFEVQNDLAVKQGMGTPPGTIKSVMGESIVPVIAKVHGEERFRCIGTGFFISCTGLLVTAGHVVMDPIERKYGGVTEVDDRSWTTNNMDLGVLVRKNPLFFGRGFDFYPIEWSAFLAEKIDEVMPFQKRSKLKLRVDVAICKVRSRPNGAAHQPLTIIQPGIKGTSLKIGANVRALGYPCMPEMFGRAPNGTCQLSNNKNLEMYVSSGKLKDWVPDNLANPSLPAPGPCFTFDAKIPGGMSGGPIFDHEGIYVHGVVSMGSDNEAGTDAFSYGAMLGAALNIPIAMMNGATLSQLHAGHTEGMAILKGGDL